MKNMRLEICVHSCYPVSANYFMGNLTAKPEICVITIGLHKRDIDQKPVKFTS